MGCVHLVHQKLYGCTRTVPREIGTVRKAVHLHTDEMTAGYASFLHKSRGAQIVGKAST